MTQTCVITPCSLRPRASRFISVRLSRRERAERITKNRFRGRPLAKRASRTPLRKDNGTRAMAQLKRAKIASTEPGLGSSLSPAFRTRMDLSACWMSQGLELVPPPPVRANCRPDIHSSRPLLLPWSGRQPLRTSAPRSTPRRPPLRAPYRYGTAVMIVILSRTSRTKSEHGPTIYSENQKTERSIHLAKPKHRGSSPRTRGPIRREASKSAGASCLN